MAAPLTAGSSFFPGPTPFDREARSSSFLHPAHSETREGVHPATRNQQKDLQKALLDCSFILKILQRGCRKPPAHPTGSDLSRIALAYSVHEQAPCMPGPWISSVSARIRSQRVLLFALSNKNTYETYFRKVKTIMNLTSERSGTGKKAIRFQIDGYVILAGTGKLQ